MKLDIKIQNSSQKVVFRRLFLMTQAIRDNVSAAVAKSTKAILKEAEQRAPTDTGQLRDSIVRASTNDGLTGYVFTRWNPYAHLVEFGSGSFYKPPAGVSRGGSAGPYRPSSTRMLAEWAERHSLPAFPVARAIGERGGVRARPFLYPAFAAERPRFNRQLRRAIRGAVKSAGRGAA